jgi:phosphate transport system substrate-binding protein
VTRRDIFILKEKRMFSLLKTSLYAAAAVAVLALSAGRAKADTRIQGAGATFPAPLYAKWVEEYQKLHPDIKVDYQAVGSGAGIKAITDRTVQFGASDAPMSADQEKAAPGKLLHLPTVAGPVVMAYNLPAVKSLKLNGDVLAAIYDKEIRTWNDPKIAALNPGTVLPSSRIIVVHRSDGSGTSFIFTGYLSAVSKTWADKVGKGTAVDWPGDIGGKGNDGVAAQVKNTEGAIGYVEYAYAAKTNIPYAVQINQDNKEVAPSIDNVVHAASASLTSFPPDMKVSIVNAPGDKSYPICGFTYLLIYDDMSYLKDKKLALQTLEFILWCETDGQKLAADLGYAKLPADAAAKVVEKLKSIKFDGQALLK